jgi:hypothetical protein
MTKLDQKRSGKYDDESHVIGYWATVVQSVYASLNANKYRLVTNITIALCIVIIALFLLFRISNGLFLTTTY